MSMPILEINQQQHGKVKAHHHQLKLMGCRFVLTAVSADPQLAWDAIRAGVAEIERIEKVISSWRADSDTTAINVNAGVRPVRVPQELLQLIQRSIRVSELTGGAFDISGTLARDYWTFDKQVHAPLSDEKIAELNDRMDYRQIEIDEAAQTVYLRKAGMKIGFGGIGKGYAAYRAKVVMEQMGILSGLVNASGDLMCWGQPPGKEDWDVRIPDPESRAHYLLSFSIPYGSVVTSGSSENYSIVDGKRLSHIVDPRTGRPVELIKSVSVICPNPELADALATAISVMGATVGLDMVNHLDGVECVIVDTDNNRYFSDHLKQFAA